MVRFFAVAVWLPSFCMVLSVEALNGPSKLTRMEMSATANTYKHGNFSTSADSAAQTGWKGHVDLLELSGSGDPIEGTGDPLQPAAQEWCEQDLHCNTSHLLRCDFQNIECFGNCESRCCRGPAYPTCEHHKCSTSPEFTLKVNASKLACLDEECAEDTPPFCCCDRASPASTSVVPHH
mmetsp:Transcript_44041/g.73262  ORF Transcript_44041/g.73262 Transcript_44041/m.73262 type:complete len:179 (+) Transcript_44041:34-570(+)